MSDDEAPRREFDLLVARFDSLEQLSAQLMMGYVELAVGLESLLRAHLEPLEPAAQAEFARLTLEAKREMFRLLEQVSADAGFHLDGGDGPVSATLRDMAGRDDPDGGRPAPGAAGPGGD